MPLVTFDRAENFLQFSPAVCPYIAGFERIKLENDNMGGDDLTEPKEDILTFHIVFMTPYWCVSFAKCVTQQL